jgi:hypothetical protein
MADIGYDKDSSELPYRRFGIPKFGFENYWCPIVTAREVKREPRASRLLGRDIALFRDGDKLSRREAVGGKMRICQQ